MQADMIVKLCKKINLCIKPGLMQKLLMADTRLIKYIMDNKIELNKLEKYFYLPLFNDYDYETQVMIFENDEGQFEKIFSLLKSSEPKDAKKILKSIYNCKCIEPEKVELAIKFFNSTSNINFSDKKEIFEILLNSKSSCNCREAYNVASNNEVKKRGHLVELTKIVANSNNPISASSVAVNENVLQSIYVVELTKIVADATKPPITAEVACVLSKLECKNVVELTKIVANAKNSFQAYIVAKNFEKFQSETAIELTKIVANAKTKKNAEFTCDIIQNTDVIKSNKIIEIATLFANTNPNNLYGMYKLVISGFLEVLICLMDVFKSKINPNNFDAVIDLLVTGNYELSKNPTESLVKILRSTNNYEKFNELYAYSDESAIKGALELDKEFPGIDIKGNTYVKMSKKKKNNNNN